MANKKQLTQETDPPVVVENQPEKPVEDSHFKNISEKLKKLRSFKGVLGYILRNGVSAEIDLQEPEKLVEYAVFTSQIVDSAKELSELFTLGDLVTTLIEGEEINVLNMVIKDSKINVFMKKSVDHLKIAEKISP